MNKSRLLAGAALLLGCLALPRPVFATGRAECLSAPSKILGHPVAYCVLLPPSYDAEKTRRYPILYLLHGLGDNEQMLIHSGGFNLVEDLWERHQLGDLLIVTPDGGSSFYINSRDAHRRYEDFFLREFLPQIEKRYRTQAGRASRGIAGISMGGYGALHLAFRHPELFGSVGAHSAALLEKLPTVTVSDSRQLARSRILGDVFGSPLDAVFWKQNDPLTIARTASLAGLQIYFDCGSEDDYGFDAGAVALDKVLGSRHIPHEFHLYPGGHNWVYVAEHLPALLQFHFRVFESASRRRNSPQ
ncbi:MAG TPA: alpha/beta hydrolase family protein [Candidatus Acidoferrum sp.]|nr:alpha/beta hydrolase family protein [Candidatus Acidoferrum sp.]